MVCVKSTRRVLDYASESRRHGIALFFDCKCSFGYAIPLRSSIIQANRTRKRRFRMKRILSAICCLTLCCLPALAQKEHAAKDAAMTDQDFINMAAQTDMLEAHLGQMAADQASSQDVKTHAQMLVTDHTADYQQLGTLAA